MVGIYNMPLRHTEFGEGKVKGWNGKTVTVRFARGDVHFWFPMAFDLGALSTTNEKDEELLQAIKSRWEAVFPAERAERFRADCAITHEAKKLKNLNADNEARADAVQRLHGTWGHIYSEAEIEEIMAAKEAKQIEDENKAAEIIRRAEAYRQIEARQKEVELKKLEAKRRKDELQRLKAERRKAESITGTKAEQSIVGAHSKILLLVSLILACVGALFAIISGILWASAMGDLEALLGGLLDQTMYGLFLSLLIIFGIGGGLAAVAGGLCAFFRVPAKVKWLGAVLITVGGLFAVGGLVVQCVLVEGFYANYSVWALLSVPLALVAAVIGWLVEKNPTK